MVGRLSTRLFLVLARKLYVHLPSSRPPRFGLDSSYPGRVASLGAKHPDRMFYVVWVDNYGSGFFSNLTHVLCHLAVADSLGMAPVVDLQNFPTFYNEDVEIAGTRNAWEYYFAQTSEISLQEVYDSRHVFFCDGRRPSGYSYKVTDHPSLSRIFDRFVKIRPDIEKTASEWAGRLSARTLGVHFRGQELNRTAGHFFGPTERQILKVTSAALEEGHFDRIFMVTEDQKCLDLFRKEFGSMVLATDSFRTSGENAYRLSPRPLHRYLLGREILVDAMVLSRCRALIASPSNVSDFAVLMNGGRFETIWTIANGKSSKNPMVALYQYGLLRRLPPRLGGLPGVVSKTSHKE
jgi:hypothetical protein